MAEQNNILGRESLLAIRDFINKKESGTKLYYHMLRYPDDGQGGGTWLLSWISNISSFDELYGVTMIDETENVVSMQIVLRDWMYEYQTYVLRVAYPAEGIDGSNVPFSFPSASISTLVNQYGCTYNVYPL